MLIKKPIRSAPAYQGQCTLLPQPIYQTLLCVSIRVLNKLFVYFLICSFKPLQTVPYHRWVSCWKEQQMCCQGTVSYCGLLPLPMIAWLGYVLTTKPFELTNTRLVVHKYEEVWKAHNSVKHDVCSSEWDNTCCVTYTWDTLVMNTLVGILSKLLPPMNYQLNHGILHTF